ncbi:ankyrin repeat domain-containing protein [Flavivirga eckloniae]|uniref:Uncharacterized protein n=1 Tax=Flavivirga eckloniae TaxID=1803846 RepID=A0A2K9PVT1_9FLAO|nr:ankyrin repeat domain-containing protein [Flavivirga eckloniae]AUP80627.1 hypothetical protein C1H87_18680 [Flavivirga eckloniae]
MKVLKLPIVFLLLVSTLQAQENIFWKRDFWKNNPTIEVIEQKIKEGNDIAALNPYGFDAVVYAILEKTPNKTIKHLLSKKGNGANKLTHDKRTYVFWAAYKGNLELMEYLISKNARMDLKDSHGFSVLTFAAVVGITDTAIYDLCIKNGIDVKTDKEEHGANALLLIIPHLKNFEMVDYFTKKGLRIDSKDNQGNGVFNYTARAGNKIMLEKLIEKGLFHNKPNNNGGNAILMATQGSRSGYNSLGFLKYLEGLGINPNITNNDGTTPLHHLAYGNKDLKTLNYFLKKGVDVNQFDKDGNTALINACGDNTLEIITALALKTKDLNKVNKNGQSALIKAINNSPSIISFLIKKGADVHVIDAKGNNLAFYLFKTFSSRKKEVFDKKVKLLISTGFNIKSTQKNGNTLYHLAIYNGDLELLQYVNTLGIDINAKNKDGLTPLHLAAMKAKNVDVLKYLLSVKADKAIKSDFDESVYDLAKENELLKQNNIDINFLK